MEKLNKTQLEKLKNFREKALEINLEIGWDCFINFVNKNTKSEYIKQVCKDYYKGYDFCVGTDIDGGKCFEIRQEAITKIMTYYNLYEFM